MTTSEKLGYGPIAAIIVTLFAFFGGQIIGLFIFASVMALISRSSVETVFNRFVNSDTGSWYQLLMVLLVEVITLLIVRRFLHWKGIKLRSLGLKKFEGFDVVRALVAFGVYFILYILTVIVVKAIFPALDTEQAQELGFDTSLQGASLIPAFLSLVILPPFVEELLMRGFLYQGLRSKLKPLGSTIITSLLFAAAHLQWGSQAPLLWVAAIDTFVLSVVLCYLRESTGRLWAPISLHALKNLIAFSILFLFKIG